ncbi:MAG: hypothetical protein JO343_11125 [Candidatus Eremiobacteraeota bacterium]|nr:hypothetical protein [Candidatus Eremiobacteraeota bacterium]
MRSKQRGSSIAEVLTVTVIIGMLLSAMVVIVPLLIRAPGQMQGQVDDVNTAAIALYKIRRDFSEGDAKGVMSCTTAPVVSCLTPGAGMTSVQALVVATAENGSGAFQIDSNGNPNWQGFYIYWLVPNSAGTSFDLMRAWEPAPGYPGPTAIYSPTAPGGSPVSVTNAIVQPLVTAALALSPPPVLTNYISQMSLGDTSSTSTIQFQLVAGTTGGADQTHTTFQSNTYARN